VSRNPARELENKLEKWGIGQGLDEGRADNEEPRKED